MSEFLERVSLGIRRSQTLRLLTVGLLVILLQIPIAMIGGQVMQRESRGLEAAEEISSKWGRAQTVTGPALVVPYATVTRSVDRDGRTTETTHTEHAFFLPETFEVRGTARTETRQRGIFSVPVYRLELTLSGRFARPDFSAFDVEPASVAWDRAQFVIGISDTRAIQTGTSLTWGGRSLLFVPGTMGKFFYAIPVVILCVLAVSLVEALFVVGTYTALAMVFNGVGLELDPGLDEIGAPPIPPTEA